MSIDTPDYTKSNAPERAVPTGVDANSPWSENQSHEINASADYDFVVHVANPDYVFFMDRVFVCWTSSAYGYLLVLINGVVYACHSIYPMASLKFSDLVSMPLFAGDEIIIRVHNSDSSARTAVVVVVGTKFVKPADIGRSPVASFTVDDQSPDVGATVSFVDGSTYNPVTWDWDFGDGSAHATSQMPTHVYSVAGSYPVKLIVTNAFGEDTCTVADYIVVGAYEDLIELTETDVEGRITVTAPMAVAVGLTGVVESRLVGDYDAGHFGDIDCRFIAKATVLPTGGKIVFIGFSNDDFSYSLLETYKLGVYMRNTPANGVQLVLSAHDGDSDYEAVRTSGIFNSVLYCRLTKALSSGICTLYVYLDPAMTYLFATLSIPVEGFVGVGLRYLHVCSSYMEASSVASSGYVSEVFL